MHPTAACLPLLLALAPAAATLQEPGEPAAPIQAARWFNHAGALPSLESLRGQTVIVHFFSTEEPAKAHLNVLRRFHHDHRAKGLVILAIAKEPAREVERYLERDNLPFAVGTGTDMWRTWNVPGEYHQVTVDPEGLVFYRGPANSLWNGKLLKGLKGCDRLGKRQPLKCVPASEGGDEFGKGARKALGLLAEGQLAKALKLVDAKLAREGGSPEDLRDAEAIREAIEDHVYLLMDQIEENLERREVLLVRNALAILVEDLARHPLGQPAIDRQDELRRDDQYNAEVEAAEKFEKLIDAYYQRGFKKNKARFEALMEKHAGTRAAEKARNVVQMRSM